MDQEKKKELAEMDSRWDFEKTVKVPDVKYNASGIDWEKVRKTFNDLQEDQGDLYMQVSKLEKPSRIEKLKMKYRGFKDSYEVEEKVVFHHSQVFEWFEGLANHLDVSLGEAVYKVLYEKEDLREELDLGDTVNVEVNNMGDIAQPKESKVSKDELQEMINDD